MAKKQTKKEDKKLNLESILFNCRDYLRSNATLNDKRDLLLTLVFLRFIGEKFEDAQIAMREECVKNGITDETIIEAFLNSPARYQNIAYVPEQARWSNLINISAAKLNGALDDALQAIDDSGDALKGCGRLGLFTSINLEANVIKKVVDEINKISHKVFGEEKDLIGRVYEYFLKSFAVNATKEDGEFYTPHDIVELIAAFIEPFDGTLYDPCCGSGGMFVQCAKYVEAKRGDIKTVNVYGQESDPATYRLAKMNLAVRGISHHLGTKNASTFTNDMHKGLVFDYIMANPPFNLKKWYDDTLSDDARWADYALPPESNANYAWILHMLSKIKAGKGIAGFLLANGALGDSDAVEIRKKLIENDKVEAIIVLPRELFYTTDISVTLWILNQNKKGGMWHDRKQRNLLERFCLWTCASGRIMLSRENRKRRWSLRLTRLSVRGIYISSGRPRAQMEQTMQSPSSIARLALKSSKRMAIPLFQAAILSLLTEIRISTTIRCLPKPHQPFQIY